MLLFAIDPSLGKVDKASLSHQTLMELLIEGVTKKSRLFPDPENPEDVSHWKGVTVNDSEEVDSIIWSHLALNGSLAFEWLPPTLTSLNVNGNFLSSTIDMTQLPPKLSDQFTVERNSLTGSVRLENLPDSLQVAKFGMNKLSGSLNLEHLPSALEVIYLSDNCFVGTISLVKLPSKLRSFSVIENALTGTVDLTKLPASLQSLFLSRNTFEGETDFSQLPDGLTGIYLSGTNLSGELRRKKGRESNLKGSQVTLVDETKK